MKAVKVHFPNTSFTLNPVDDVTTQQLVDAFNQGYGFTVNDPKWKRSMHVNADMVTYIEVTEASVGAFDRADDPKTTVNVDI